MNEITDQYEYLVEEYAPQVAGAILIAQGLAELKESVDEIRRDLVRVEWLVEHNGEDS